MTRAIPAWLVGLSIAYVCLTPATSAADVADASPGGFTVRWVLEVDASPDRVYEALVDEVDRWWAPSHTFSGNSANLSIEAEPGGCFCERFPEGGGVRHAVVVHAAPGRMLRMSGALGPMQGLGVTGTMTFSMAGVDAGTELVFTYAVAGHVEGDLGQTWSGPVDGVLEIQVERLRRYVETGTAAEEGSGDGGAR